MTPDEKYQYAKSFPAVVGCDTSKQFHVMVVQDAHGVRGKAFRVNVGRQEFEALDAQLRVSLPALTAGQILVGIEFAGHHGFTLAQFLNDRGYRVVNVLPSVTKRSKEIEDNSPLKTDAKDAAVIARLTSEGKFVDFPFLDPTHASLRGLTMNHHRLTGERTRLKNRLQGLLDVAWPEFTKSFVTVLSPTPCAILSRWPVPQDLVLASPRMVRKVAKDASRNHVKAEAVSTCWRTRRLRSRCEPGSTSAALRCSRSWRAST